MNSHTRRAFTADRILLAFMTSISAALMPLPSAAFELTDYPSRPIRMIISSAAGGPLDLVGRTVAEKLSASLKQPVVVEAKSGAGGNVAADFVSKAPPDGYTLLLVLSTTLTVNPHLYPNLTFNLKPISIVNYSTQMLVVHPSVPAGNLAEFVRWAKENGPVTYGHAGNGSPAHLAMEYFRLRAGFKTVPVPYRGAAPLVSDLLAGRFKAAFGSTASLLPYVTTGRLRPLAVSTAERSPLAPNVPTVAESGYPGFNLTTDFILMAPGGTPDEIVSLLQHETKQALESKEIQASFRQQDIWVVGSTPEEAAASIKAGYDLWADVIKRAGMSAN